MTKEELQKMLDEFKAGLPQGMTKEDIDKAVAAKMAEMESGLTSKLEKLESIEKSVTDIGAKITEMETESKERSESGRMFTNEQFKAIKDAVSEGRVLDQSFKAPAIITTANFANAPHSLSYEVDRTVNAPPSPERKVYDRLARGRTNARTIIWTNRVNEEGGAAFIAEGALKPLKDWERQEFTSLAKKVAVRATLTNEALEDVYALEEEVREVLYGEVVNEIASAILSGNPATGGAGGVPAPEQLQGIIPLATGYTTTSLNDQVDAANRADAIRAGMLQMRLLQHTPTVVFLNPGDAALLDLTKDANGNYIRLQIEGVLQRIDVIETTEITMGYFLLMDERKWKIKMLRDIEARWGYSTGDFEYNRVSVIFEARLHSYINSIDLGAVMYAQFSTVIAAIQKPDPEP